MMSIRRQGDTPIEVSKAHSPHCTGIDGETALQANATWFVRVGKSCPRLHDLREKTHTSQGLENIRRDGPFGLNYAIKISNRVDIAIRCEQITPC